MRGGVDPWKLSFHPRVVGEVDVWKESLIRRLDLLPGGGRNLDVAPRGNYPRPDTMNSSAYAISQWGWGLHTVRGIIDPWDLRCCPRVVGGLEIEKDI